MKEISFKGIKHIRILTPVKNIGYNLQECLMDDVKAQILSHPWESYEGCSRYKCKCGAYLIRMIDNYDLHVPHMLKEDNNFSHYDEDDLMIRDLMT